MPDFDPLEPFENDQLLREVLDGLERFEYKLYGRIPLNFHRGNPTHYEFDLNLGVVHITEQDCQGLSELFGRFNKAWRTRMTFCIYPSKERPRDIILNIRGSPKAPAEID